MFLRITLLSLCLFLALSGPAAAFRGHVQNFSDNATLFWGDGEINVFRPLEPSADGDTLSPLAVRKAVISARKQLLDIILSTRINSKATVSAYLSEDADLAARVRGMVQNSPLERPAMFDETGEVRVYETFRGKLAELVLPTTIQFQSGIPPKLSTSLEQQFEYQQAPPEVAGNGSISYTGVIIDARGLQVTPCLSPVVYGQDGVGAYGAFLVSRENAIRNGVVAYSTTPDPAQLRSRVGSNPLIIRALNAYGSWRTDLIISTPMANLVRATMSSPSLAGNSRVVIVLSDELPKAEEQ